MYKRFLISLNWVFLRIRNTHNGRIPYESLTYGELITFINNKGLAHCTNFKLKSQMEKEKQDSKKELEIFFHIMVMIQ